MQQHKHPGGERHSPNETPHPAPTLSLATLPIRFHISMRSCNLGAARHRGTVASIGLPARAGMPAGQKVQHSAGAEASSSTAALIPVLLMKKLLEARCSLSVTPPHVPHAVV